jgi:Cu/Ag efflux pump CusA
MGTARRCLRLSAPASPRRLPHRLRALREVAALREIAAPAMVRDEDGRLCGYVDVDSATRDLADYVEDGMAALARWQTTGALTLPPDTTVRWTWWRRCWREPSSGCARN